MNESDLFELAVLEPDAAFLASVRSLLEPELVGNGTSSAGPVEPMLDVVEIGPSRPRRSRWLIAGGLAAASIALIVGLSLRTSRPQPTVGTEPTSSPSTVPSVASTSAPTTTGSTDDMRTLDEMVIDATGYDLAELGAAVTAVQDEAIVTCLRDGGWPTNPDLRRSLRAQPAWTSEPSTYGFSALQQVTALGRQPLSDELLEAAGWCADTERSAFDPLHDLRIFQSEALRGNPVASAPEYVAAVEAFDSCVAAAGYPDGLDDLLAGMSREASIAVFDFQQGSVTREETVRHLMALRSSELVIDQATAPCATALDDVEQRLVDDLAAAHLAANRARAATLIDEFVRDGLSELRPWLDGAEADVAVSDLSSLLPQFVAPELAAVPLADLVPTASNEQQLTLTNDPSRGVCLTMSNGPGRDSSSNCDGGPLGALLLGVVVPTDPQAAATLYMAYPSDVTITLDEPCAIGAAPATPEITLAACDVGTFRGELTIHIEFSGVRYRSTMSIPDTAAFTTTPSG